MGWGLGVQIGRRHRRRGAAYFLIVGATMLVTIMGMSAITVARLRTRSLLGVRDVHQAGLLAFSAVELAMTKIKDKTADGDPQWRTTYTSGVETTPKSLGGGTVSWMLVDEVDGNLANSELGSVRLYGIGRAGEATRVYSVLLTPGGDGLSCLETAMHVEKDIFFDDTIVQSDQIISGNDDVSATNSTIDSDVEVVGSYSGGTYQSTPATGVAPRTLPDSNGVFDYYLATGTPIDYWDLESDFGNTRVLRWTVLSPASNAYGSGRTNNEGIYVIDCMNQKIRIRNCRIVGTLVLLNVPVDSEIFGQIHWEPAVANYPALLVEGKINFSFDGSQPLNEASGSNVNYNPPGTPYEGQEDSDKDDTYPTIVKGLVYVSGQVTMTLAPAFEGAVTIGDELNVSATLNLTYQDIFLHNPPPGFRGGEKMVPLRGTWQRGTLP